MKNLLLIYLTDHTATMAHWLLLNETGVKSESSTPCLLSECPSSENNTETVILFPAEEILLTTAALPPTQPSQQAIAALYSLEEKLAEDVLDLHAIILERLDKELFSVGIIRRALLEDWLKKFKEASLNPQYLFPDIFAIPYQQTYWSALFFQARVLIRSGLSQGFATQKTHYELLIHKQEHPEILEINDNTLEPFLKTLQENLSTMRPFNLLQGKYRQKTHWQEMKKIWQLPALLTIIWLIILIIFILSKSFLLSRESANLDHQITTLYQQVYPEAASVISPELRITQDIKRLKTTQQHQESLELIAKTGQILKEAPDTTIESLSFRDDTLRLSIQTKDFQSLEKIVTQLQQKQLEVKQSDATRSGENVSATLSLKNKGVQDDKNG